MIKYRQDIDGLRSLAILPVLFFHLGAIRLFPGGFVGVDVFFVISGYLITKIIYDDLSNERYSIARFYERRIRRIVPALIPVYLFVCVGALLLYFPSEGREIGRTVVSSIFFVSNILFYAKSGYFDAGAKTSPLLHTWSLSVEEQFYIVLPLLLVLILRFGFAVQRYVFVALTIISFVASVVMVRLQPEAAFYLLPFRAWELMLGSLISIGVVPAIRSRPLAEIVAGGGLLLIIGSILLISEKMPFPGLLAAPACLGAAALIHAGASFQTLPTRLLSLAPARFVGLISYSLYIWHWPVIVFYASRTGELDKADKLILLAIITALAILSWRFVERPFRKPHGADSRMGPVYGWAVGSFVAVTALALLIAPARKAIWPDYAVPEQILAFQTPPRAAMRNGTCFIASGSGAQDYDAAQCLSLRAGARNVLLIGDSHAAHLYAGLTKAFPDVHFLQANASGCMPLGRFAVPERCTQVISKAFDFAAAHGKQLDGVIISARWKKGDARRIGDTIARIGSAVPVTIVGPSVEYRLPLPKILAQAWPDQSGGSSGSFRGEPGPGLDKAMRVAVERAGARYISMEEAICPGGTCRVWAGQHIPLQFDEGHLTTQASHLIVAQIAPQFRFR